ncbi:RbsD/FucU domain-containing protein [Litorivicinus lipolyticus]
MGHGDSIALVDANYPAAAQATRLICARGFGLIDALQAVQSLLPLESASMPNAERPIHQKIQQCCKISVAPLPDSEFYSAVRGCFAIVATGAPELYGNVVLTKAAIGS